MMMYKFDGLNFEEEVTDFNIRNFEEFMSEGAFVDDEVLEEAYV